MMIDVMMGVCVYNSMGLTNKGEGSVSHSAEELPGGGLGSGEDSYTILCLLQRPALRRLLPGDSVKESVKQRMCQTG